MFNLKLEQLKVFIAIAGSGSISDAAPKVSRSPAAVSMTLSQMEKQLGGKLFVCERKSKLTPLGRTVLTNAQRVMEEYQRALTNIQLFAEGRQGHVKIAVVPSVAIRILPLAVAELREEYPAVTIDIRDTDSQSIHQQVENGIVDFGIASHPGHDLLYSDYLYEDRFQLVSPRAHPLCARKGV